MSQGDSGWPDRPGRIEDQAGLARDWAAREGYRYSGARACGKCGDPVEVWKSEAGMVRTFNSAQHDTWPGALHELHCGDRDPVVELPPPTDQWARAREMGLDPEKLMEGTVGDPGASVKGTLDD